VLPPHHPKHPPAKRVHGLQQLLRGALRNIPPSNCNSKPDSRLPQRPLRRFEPRPSGAPGATEALCQVRAALATQDPDPSGKSLQSRAAPFRKAKLARLKDEVRQRRHTPVIEQYAWLSSVLTGHYRYYGVPTNYRALAQFRERVRHMWHASLQRRSQRGRWNEQKYKSFNERFSLPRPHIHHPWPRTRFALR
jgi:hypothetical protein